MAVFDGPGLKRYLRVHWGIDGLIDLLESSRTDLAKIAALGLGHLGDAAAVPALLGALIHEDDTVTRMSEYSLWTLWFGEAGEEAEAKLRHASHLPYEDAVVVLDRLIGQHPDWLEPINQRSIVHFRQRCFISAMQDCRTVLSSNPAHFGALAGLGHTYAQLGCYKEAESCYRKALRIHPRMRGVRQSLRTVRELHNA